MMMMLLANAKVILIIKCKKNYKKLLERRKKIMIGLSRGAKK